MISRIDHVSIAVKDYEKAIDFFQNILGAIPGAAGTDDSMKYFWQLFSLGDLSRFELLKPTGDGSYLDNFLKKKKDGGAHHITMQTPDIYEAKKTLDVHDIPYFGFNDYGIFWKELFIHPKDAFGLLIQIAEFIPDDWIADTVKLPSGKKWNIDKTDDKCFLEMANPGGGKIRFELTTEEVRNLVNDLEKVC